MGDEDQAGIIREILHPELDPVRRNYLDDPDGGLLDGAPDAPWLSRWRPRRTAPGSAEPTDSQEPVAAVSS